MGFTWLDGLLAVLTVALVLWEIRRDLGQAIFDTMAMLLGLRLAIWLGPALATQLGMASPHQAKAVALIVLFVLGTAAGLGIGYYLNNLTHWTLDQFDRVAGAVLGLSSAVMLCHVIVLAITLCGATKAGPPKYVAKSRLAREVLTFQSFHQVVKFFDGIRESTRT